MIAPTRCNQTKTTSIAGLASKTLAPNSSSTPWNVTQAWCGSAATVVSDSTGACWYPPRAWMIRGAAEPSPPATAAAPARDSSYHRDAGRSPRLIRPAHARTTTTSTSGAMQVISTIESATMVQVSRTNTTAGRATARPPAVGRNPVDHQPRHQHRHGGTGMVRRQEHDLGGAELGRHHDARGQQRPGPAPPGPGPPLGEPGGQQYEQRVGHGRAHVDHPGPQSQHGLDQRVLREFGGVERNVRDPPAVQQQVPVQHGPGLQHVARPVGGHGHRLGLAPVQDEQAGGRQHDHGEPPGRARPRARGPRRAHRGLGGHKGQDYGPAGPRATGHSEGRRSMSTASGSRG